MEDYSKYSIEDFQLMVKELNRPVETFGDIAVRLCELISCENCPVVIHNCDKRTEYEKKVLQYTCCEQLHNWIVQQAKEIK